MAAIFNVLGLVFLAKLSSASVVTNLNGASGYQKWPGNIVYYTLTNPPNPLTTVQDYNTLTDAMQQISMDLGYCVNFTNLQSLGNPAVASKVVFQTRFSSTASPNDMCFTYPGYLPSSGPNGQISTVFSSQTPGGNQAGGCLDQKRDAMRILANLLGLQNEYLRTDRNTYINLQGSDPNQLVTTNLQKYNLFAAQRLLQPPAYTIADPVFDYNSITMVSGQRYAATSSPVFTLPSGVTAGAQARLSLRDCQALKQLYACPFSGLGPTPTCADPYSVGSSAITFSPSPSVITRSVQCATSGAAATATQPAVIGRFIINGLTGFSGTPSPTFTITPAIPGLSVTMESTNAPLTIPASSAAAVAAAVGPPAVAASPATVGGQYSTPCTNGAAPGCVFIAVFSLSQQLSRGLTNQQITVGVTTAAGTATAAQTYAVPVTLNLNCAPQWQSATAFQVGVAGPLTATQTKTPGVGINSIQAVPQPNPTPSAVQSYNTAGGAPQIQTFANNLVQNIVEFGTAGQINTVPATNPPVTKVFVNCGSTLSNAADGTTGGYTVLGQVQASDPEGNDVSYFISSEGFASVTTANTGVERFDITPNGIITMFVPPVASYTFAAADPVNQPNPNVANQAGAAVTTNTIRRNLYVSAVDAQGGISVLEYRAWIGCGPNLV